MPWYHADPKNEHEAIAQRSLSSCEVVHGKVTANAATTEYLKSRGFVLNMVKDPRSQNV